MFSPRDRSSVPVFKVKKKHSWKGNLIRFLELTLLFIVISGTVFWYLSQSHFSLPKFFDSVKSALSPKIEKKVVNKTETAEDKLTRIIKESRLFEIESLKKIESGFEVRSKNNLLVVFSDDKDFSESVRTLQTLLAKAKIDNKTVKRVDFRFDKLIVE